MKTLDKLLAFLNKSVPSINIDYVSCNSKDIQTNTLFIALKGNNYDARKDIEDVINRGAVAVIYDECSDGFWVAESINSVPCFACNKLSEKLSLIAAEFYEHPSSECELIGVTGTNGKSTVTHLVAQWNTILRKKTAILGTLGNGFYSNLEYSANTTMQALELEKKIKELRNEGAEAIAMEVSSHGIALKRVSELHFSIAAFTNLSRDHLDFHKTMENYENTKFELFLKVSEDHCVLNVDDEVGRRFYSKLPKSLIYSTNKLSEPNSIYAENIKYLKDGISFTLNGIYGSSEFKFRLIGGFNVQNALCAIGIMLVQGYSLNDLSSTSEQLCAITGRMECFKGNNTPLLIVDYAHTPDGLEKALSSIKDHNFGKCICVCGCGGDRDSGKRPIMALTACKNVDRVIFTNDNPRTEDPKSIVDMMLAGVQDYSNYEVILDRESAIKRAYELSNNKDVILIAGKGHEDYQIIGKVKHYYSDRDVAKKLVGDREE